MTTPSTSGHLDEVAKLRALLAGQHFDSLWDSQDFRPLPKPQEAYDWPRMQAARDAGSQAPVGRTVRPGIVEYR